MARELSLVYEVSSIVSSGSTPEQMLEALVRLAVKVTGCDACLVYLPEPSTGELVLRASQLPHAGELGELRMKMGEGVTGWVAEHAQVVALARNAASDPRFKPFPSLAEDSYEALLSAPLVAGGAVVGVINVHHQAPHAHTAEEIALLKFLGEQLGGAIAKSRLEREASEIRRELETRKVVERAKGILQRSSGLSEEEAYHRLRNQSRRSRRPMRELAEAIILAEELSRTKGQF